MNKKNPSAGRTGKIIYWTATIWLALGMVSTGLVQLFKGKAGQGGADMVTHLGYPIYLLTILGIWKILGVVAVLVPKFCFAKGMGLCRFLFCNDRRYVFAHCIG